MQKQIPKSAVTVPLVTQVRPSAENSKTIQSIFSHNPHPFRAVWQQIDQSFLHRARSKGKQCKGYGYRFTNPSKKNAQLMHHEKGGKLSQP